MENKFNPAEYWESRLSKTYNLLGVGDITLGEKYNDLIYKVRIHAFNNVLKKINQNLSDKRILDVGSGTGFYVKLWEKESPIYLMGSDLTNVAVQNLTNNFKGINFRQIDITSDNIGVESNSFDIVSAFDVLFHVVDDIKFEKAISNIHKLLKPGGIFIYSDNFIHGKTIRVEHQVSRSLDFNNQIMDKIGFKQELVKPMFVLMNDPVDSRNKALKFFFHRMTKLIRKWNWFSSFLSVTLYPLELLLIKLKRESPSTEIRVYVKK